MTRRKDPRQMNGGWQMDLFTEPEPSATADRSSSAAAAWAEARGLHLQTGPAGTAVLSPCGTYRYRLDRVWDEQAPPLVWVMLNPSRGDADEDDATLRRCTTFSKKAGYGGLTVVNLYALRSTDPTRLRTHADPKGPANIDAVADVVVGATGVVAAWGALHPSQVPHAQMIVSLIEAGYGGPLSCLGLTGSGHPRHPLRLPDSTELAPYVPLPPAGPHEPTTVVDLHGHQGDPAFTDVVYVGRPMYQGGWRLHGHVLANPFKVGKHGDAAAVVEKYRAWLAERPQLLARELPKLRGRRLGCWCSDGQPCHARVLAELADQGVQA
ncbi:DUF1643 domain-containing protein [Streptomyces sp. NPDC002766]|uniref:DUF1643 domain-containing protein n=1 Tax=Streptomyces sp. NPDC002766 TaxID=3154429 RepID=UPI00332019CE